ncbi:MAG: DeoR/GlpR family DNA-binding transcription regulator [Anaerolineales bacterium]|nr:DeoR/GlpR family DNA-binding transcription regulator [Anaerolineales bacterium]
MSKNLIPAQRRELIIEYLAAHKIAPSVELCKLLDVSEATIRRDLEWLENEGILERTHGGAVLSERMRFEPEYMLRAQSNIEEKRAIGAAAAALIENGDTVYINSGTTTTHIIRNIPKNAAITLITNNLQAALEIGEVGYEFILLGGAYQPKSISVTGGFAVANLNQVYADKAFIGVDGFSLKYGCTVPSFAEAEVIRIMCERTRGPLTLVADHSKWGVVSNYEVARIEDFKRLIIDEGLDEDARKDLASRSLELIIAGLAETRN